MHNKKIRGTSIVPSGGRPANLHRPTNIKGYVKSGVSVKTTLPTGYITGGEKFMGKPASGPKKIVTTLPRG